MSFFDTLISYIEIAWNFFLNIINSMFSLLTALLGATIVPPVVVTHMWGPIGACCLAVTGFAVIKMIVGRSNV